MKDFQHIETQLVETEKLIPYKDNPKKHPESQIKRLVSSIKNYGFNQDIVVDEDYEIIVGHGRLKAAKHLGLDKVPVKVAEHLTDAEANAYRIADNETNDTGVDDEKLAQELEKIKDSDAYEEFMETADDGRVNEYLDKHINEEDLEEPDTEDPETVETDIQEGEVFKLGEHRLMCGNATNEEHVDTLMNGNKADMLLTDPPYGIGESNEKNKSRGTKAEPTDYGHYEWDSERVDEKAIKNCLNYSNNQIIFGGNYYTDYLPPSPCWIIWDKKNGDTDFADAELAWGSFDRAARITEYTWHGMIREGGEDRVHPTQKPVELFARIIKTYSKNEYSILDLFAGSGTTLLAAEQTNRKAYCMELDPQYCQIIINRWEELTGKKAEPVT